MEKIIKLGAFDSDITQVVQHLKQDLQDDWYPDPLAYEDALTPDVAGELLNQCLERNHGLYVPDAATTLNIPKKGFVLRYSLEMTLPDRLYYHALVGQLVPFFDSLLPPHILNHRFAAEGRRKGRYLFKPPIEQWQLFEGYVAQEARTKPVILVTDLQNYYENVTVEHITTVLENNVSCVQADTMEKAGIRRVISELRRCLGAWCYAAGRGLPQNRDASSFLASLAILPVDQAMLDKQYAYYRYMDDIRVAAKTRYEARAALQDLTVELRKIGLSVNAAKTKIYEPKDPEYQKAMGNFDPRLAQIDSMWKSRSLLVVRRSFTPLQKLANSLIERGETQDRGFRFCVRRFERLALCDAISIPRDFFDPMTDACLAQLDEQPFSSDQFVRYLKATPTSDAQMEHVVHLLADNQRAIYDWQNYLLWQLLVYKKVSVPALIAVARERSTDSSAYLQ